MSFLWSFVFCFFTYRAESIPVTFDRLNHCNQIVMHSKAYSIDPTVAVSVLLVESKGSAPPIKYPKSPRGPMQVTPTWCKNQTFSNCNLLKAGVRALWLLRRCHISGIDWDTQECKRARSTPQPWGEVLCTYNTGRSCSIRPKGQLYKEYVFRVKKRVRKVQERLTYL